MAQKVCKKCRAIFDGSKCTKCGSDEVSDSFKGRVKVLNPGESEIAKNLKINEKGDYAVKVG